MKIILLANLFQALLAMAALADNENIYCGEGRDSYSVDKAKIALVVQDGKPKLYGDGKNQTKYYKITKSSEGYEALPKPSAGKNWPAIAFKHCKEDNLTSAHFIGGMVSNDPFPCTCETD